MSADTALDMVLNAVLKEVSGRCDFIHAEAFRPVGNSCMVQSGASFCANAAATDFHR
jgi:hypothetical protein